MKNFLRWLLVLPVAVVTAYAVEFINAVFSSGEPSMVRQWWISWISPFAFVAVGSYVAPTFKFAVSVVLSLMMSAFVIVLLTIEMRQSYISHWNQIVCTVFSVLATVIACFAVGIQRHGNDAEIEVERDVIERHDDF